MLVLLATNSIRLTTFVLFQFIFFYKVCRYSNRNLQICIFIVEPNSRINTCILISCMCGYLKKPVFSDVNSCISMNQPRHWFDLLYIFCCTNKKCRQIGLNQFLPGRQVQSTLLLSRDFTAHTMPVLSEMYILLHEIRGTMQKHLHIFRQNTLFLPFLLNNSSAINTMEKQSRF